MGQRVRAEGREGVYVVVKLDRDRRIVDLMLDSGTHPIARDIPFDTIRPFHQKSDRSGLPYFGPKN